MNRNETWTDRLRRLLADERGGERDTLTTLLLLALVVIPLVLVIIAFGEEIMSYVQDRWGELMGSPVGG